ncbi:YmL10 [Rhizophlyctis rosea]|uniref:YmL10 n=1 Tax=Rhizophlyctis rosea TaxID=64517 RepID=A0AAD5X2F3_9FUNG|nr:YmL10 [Rhizophlyctis rosea]
MCRLPSAIPQTHKAIPFRIPTSPLFSQSATISIVSRPTKFLNAANVADNKGARRIAPVWGRGGTRGKTAGRGMKGFKARNGRALPERGYEGGQPGIKAQIPKLGKLGMKADKPYFSKLNLDTLQYMIDSGRINPNQKITFKELHESRAIHKTRDGVVLLAKGGNNFTHKVDIEVQRVSENAAKVIEGLGGKVTAVYIDQQTIHAIKNPERYAIMPPAVSIPTHPTTLAKYIDPERRGYLAHAVEGATKDNIVERILAATRPRKAKKVVEEQQAE